MPADYIWPNPTGNQKQFTLAATAGSQCGKFAKDNEKDVKIVTGPLNDIDNRLREDNN